MIAEVVIHARTPRATQGFDYRVPETLPVHIGDIVSIPFRSSTVYGMVIDMRPTTPHTRIRDIIAVYPDTRWRSLAAREWLRWFADWHAISLSHAFKTLQYTLPKRIKTVAAINQSSTQLALNLPALSHPRSIRAQRYATLLDWYIQHQRKTRGHTLCIVPHAHAAKRITDALRDTSITLSIDSRTSGNQLRTLEQRLAGEETPLCIIGTKKALTLNPLLFSSLILDQEESPLHKQRDANPRFHLRRILLERAHKAILHEEAFPQLFLTSIAPSSEVAKAVKDGTVSEQVLPEPHERESHVRIISMDEEKRSGNYTWFAQEVVETIHHSTKTLLFLNRTGRYSYTVCTTCRYVAELHTLRCPQCGDTRFHMVRKGIQQLEREVKDLFPTKTVISIDSTTEEGSIPTNIDSADIVLSTEKILYSTDLSSFTYCVILSVDHLLCYPHYRAHERTYQLLRSFFSVGIPCALQTHSPNHPIIQAAAKHDYAQYMTNELHLRSLTHTPPYGYRARALHTRTKEWSSLYTRPPQALSDDYVLDPEY